jgi:hypothetical protein
MRGQYLGRFWRLFVWLYDYDGDSKKDRLSIAIARSGL